MNDEQKDLYNAIYNLINDLWERTRASVLFVGIVLALIIIFFGGGDCKCPQ